MALRRDSLFHKYYDWHLKQETHGYHAISLIFSQPGATLIIAAQFDGCTSNCGSVCHHLWDKGEEAESDEAFALECAALTSALSDLGDAGAVKIINRFMKRWPEIRRLIAQRDKSEAADTRLQRLEAISQMPQQDKNATEL